MHTFLVQVDMLMVIFTVQVVNHVCVLIFDQRELALFSPILLRARFIALLP
jgi:hypothetical protein